MALKAGIARSYSEQHKDPPSGSGQKYFTDNAQGIIPNPFQWQYIPCTERCHNQHWTLQNDQEPISKLQLLYISYDISTIVFHDRTQKAGVTQRFVYLRFKPTSAVPPYTYYIPRLLPDQCLGWINKGREKIWINVVIFTVNIEP